MSDEAGDYDILIYALAKSKSGWFNTAQEANQEAVRLKEQFILDNPGAQYVFHEIERVKEEDND